MTNEVILANAWSKVSGTIVGFQTGPLDTGGVCVVLDIRTPDQPHASLRWVISKEGGSVIARTASKSLIYTSMQDALAGLAPLSPAQVRSAMQIADGTSCRHSQAASVTAASAEDRATERPLLAFGGALADAVPSPLGSPR